MIRENLVREKHVAPIIIILLNFIKHKAYMYPVGERALSTSSVMLSSFVNTSGISRLSRLDSTPLLSTTSSTAPSVIMNICLDRRSLLNWI
jgi:hypothetical protein